MTRDACLLPVPQVASPIKGYLWPSKPITATFAHFCNTSIGVDNAEPEYEPDLIKDDSNDLFCELTPAFLTKKLIHRYLWNVSLLTMGGLCVGLNP